AACHIKGGLDSLLTQAPQDWQFDVIAHTSQNPHSGDFDLAVDQLVKQALQSTAGPRLVASGLALKAWLR
ncbi:MAG: hypothetical protein NWS28_10510, partial [Limnohabitans sp.]|nr:hypothetical protein [Limnohabitans sp.]